MIFTSMFMIMTFHLMEIMILKEVDRISIETKDRFARFGVSHYKVEVAIAFFCCRRHTVILSIFCFVLY